jgi:hypothetical protein
VPLDLPATPNLPPYSAPPYSALTIARMNKIPLDVLNAASVKLPVGY